MSQLLQIVQGTRSLDVDASTSQRLARALEGARPVDESHHQIGRHRSPPALRMCADGSPEATDLVGN
jgi:hypothetical protein